MKVCIVGAGAIGGFIGTKLAAAGRAEVSALARGATLAALRQHGWRMNSAAGLVSAPAHASDSAAELGAQDLVVIAVKGPALSAVARSIAPLLGPQTLVLPAMNGVPWWFCAGVPGFEGVTLESVDPGGAIAAAIPFEQVLGCVVHASTSTPEPGLVQHKMGQGLIVGEPRGGRSERAQRVVDLLAHAGFDATHADDVRYDIWYKLWGNMTMNPVSAITGATIDRVLGDPLVREFCSAAMREAAAIGARIGCAHRAVARRPPRDHRQARRVQDLDAAGRGGRPRDRARCDRHCRARDRPAPAASRCRTSPRCSASRACSAACTGCTRRQGSQSAQAQRRHRADGDAVAAAGAGRGVDLHLRDAAARRHEAQRVRIAGVAADAALHAAPVQAVVGDLHTPGKGVRVRARVDRARGAGLRAVAAQAAAGRREVDLRKAAIAAAQHAAWAGAHAVAAARAALGERRRRAGATTAAVRRRAARQRSRHADHREEMSADSDRPWTGFELMVVKCSAI